jgi:hypothetical protein
LVVCSGGSPPHPFKKSTEAQRQHEQRTDKHRHVDHEGGHPVASRFEEHPGDEQNIEQQDQGSGTPKTGRLSAILW